MIGCDATPPPPGWKRSKYLASIAKHFVNYPQLGFVLPIVVVEPSIISYLAAKARTVRFVVTLDENTDARNTIPHFRLVLRGANELPVVRLSRCLEPRV